MPIVATYTPRLVPCELGEGFVCGFTCSRVHTEYPMLCTLSFLGVSCTTYTRCETYFSNQMLSTAYPPLILPINASNPCVFDKEICRTLYQKCNALVYTYNQILSSLA